MGRTRELTDTLEIVEEETNGTKVTWGEICETLNHRGFGALLIVPSILTILPTGALPGVPAVSGIFICFITIQIIAGRKYPWIPGVFKKFKISRNKLTKAIAWAKPYTKIIDSFIHPRLDVCQHTVIQRLVAVCCFILGLLMVFFGFIPFLPAMVAVPVLFFALGVSARDGFMILAGFGFMTAALVMLLWLSGSIGGEDKLHIGEPIFVRQAPYAFDLDLFDKLSREI
jgi:hypothetical protein